MAENKKKSFGGDDFWDLDKFLPKRPAPKPVKQFPKSYTEAISIEQKEHMINTYMHFSDSKLTESKPAAKSDNVTKSDDSTITRFIPPHNDSIYSKKHILFEYEPKNPLIKSIKICSDKENDVIFPDNNLFIRERRAILNRKAVESPYIAFYSYSPRYSQMSRGQLNWYLWWRENTRKGIFLNTDESYIILYAYELAATGKDENKEAARDMLCDLITNYSSKNLSYVFKLMIRDLLCDFCLVHGLTMPLDKLSKLGRAFLANFFLPEFFIDISAENCTSDLGAGLSSISMYNYKQSKFYTPESSDFFNRVMDGALSAIISNKRSFEALTSFTNGIYGSVTAERRPFSRMINIVNKSIKLEICYFQLANIQSTITNALRYSENKLREHMGIKSKLHIMAINPAVKEALDIFFDENYPSMPTVDRRRKNAAHTDQENEVHEYDHFYDVPKAEISPERALEIERDSWSTTKILTEAFADGSESTQAEAPEEIQGCDTYIEKSASEVHNECENKTVSVTFTDDKSPAEGSGGLLGQITAVIGDIAQFIELCKSPSALAQRKFASSKALSTDEIADMINECAANVFGDIILEDIGGAYGIIEDYIDEF